VVVLVDVAQRLRLERGGMVVEPPPHLRVGAEPEVDAGVVVRVERHPLERIAVAMDHADRPDLHGRVDDVTIERGEQRRRGRAVEASVVKEDLEDARQGRLDHTARW